MAIGLGLMFGYRLPINFNVPYRAGSIQEFWQRWHITLSRFLRDYVYISLGGNRHGFPQQLAAIFLTMLLGGLWHGAGWTYVIWGGMHGLGLVFHRCWQDLGFRLPRLVGWALTMLFVMFSFVLFRAESFSGAWAVASGMLGFNGIVTVGNEVDGRFWRLMLVGALIATVGPSSYQVAVERLRPAVWKAVLVSVVLVYLILETGSGGYSEFIYFQF
jgi:D-alanyl-lipoteichoic acid acyltransferase DltB (MBOAT superfamily)